MKILPHALALALSLGAACLRGEDTPAPAVPHENVKVGGKVIHFVPPTGGFVRCDGLNAGWDTASTSMLPATNRRLIAFSTPADRDAIKAGQAPAFTRSFNSQITTSVEFKDVGEQDFQQQRAAVRAGLEQMRGKLQTTADSLVKKGNASLHDKYGVDAALSLNDLAVVGPYMETASSFGFTLVMNIKGIPGKEGRSEKAVVACLMLPVNGRLLNLYANSEYRDDADREWAEKAVAQWRDALVAANDRVLTAHGGPDPAYIAGAATGAAVVGLLVLLITRRKA